MTFRWASMVLVCVLVAHTARAQESPHAFVGAQLLPITQPPIENGVLVVHEGKNGQVVSREVR